MKGEQMDYGEEKGKSEGRERGFLGVIGSAPIN
jgi:hypothetical protein